MNTDQLQQELKRTQLELAETKESLQKFTVIWEAEKAGRAAARTQVTLADNPCTDEETKAGWEHGWFSEKLPDDLKKMQAVMIWTVQYVATVIDLARGYGYDELARKLDILVEKISFYAEGS